MASAERSISVSHHLSPQVAQLKVNYLHNLSLSIGTIAWIILEASPNMIHILPIARTRIINEQLNSISVRAIAFLVPPS